MLIEGQIIGFVGQLRSGKSLSMTRMGALEALQGRRVWANYRTSFAEHIQSLEHLYSLEDGVLMLDEFQATTDAREFKSNVELSQWLVLIGKRRLSLLFTTQWIGQVDVRVRQNMSHLVYCEGLVLKSGGKATKRQFYRMAFESARLYKKDVLIHTPELYGLYDTRDTEVKLTKDARIVSFDAGVSPVADRRVRRS